MKCRLPKAAELIAPLKQIIAAAVCDPHIDELAIKKPIVGMP